MPRVQLGKYPVYGDPNFLEQHTTYWTRRHYFDFIIIIIIIIRRPSLHFVYLTRLRIYTLWRISALLKTVRYSYNGFIWYKMWNVWTYWYNFEFSSPKVYLSTRVSSEHILDERVCIPRNEYIPFIPYELSKMRYL